MNIKKIWKKKIKLFVALLIVVFGVFVYYNYFLWRNITFQGCGSSLPDYKYSLQLPASWTINRRDLGKYSIYYDAEGNSRKFTIGCTTQGVGSDVCDEKYLTKFTIDGKTEQACYGQTDGKWNLGALNLPRDPSNQAAISFWAQNIDPTMLNKILSSFRIQK